MDADGVPVDELEVANVSGRSGREVALLVDPRRLRRAREMRGYTQRDVIERMGEGAISGPALSQLERGGFRPNPATLEALARVLDVPTDFFTARFDVQTPEADHEGFFRTLRSTSARDRRRARAYAFLLHDLVGLIERHVRLPELRVPDHSVPADMARDEVERVAERVRAEWGLPPGPVSNAVRVLERAGVVVVRLHTHSRHVDAFSIPFKDRPIVILADDKLNQFRSRFDAGHELGHLVMHRGAEPGVRETEQQAHWFSAAFLMPADEIITELPQRVDWRRLLDLKVRWGVSLAALLLRARTLEVISPSTYVNAMKTMSARGWRRVEPGDAELGPPESPVLLQRGVQMLENCGFRLDETLHGAGLPFRDVHAMLEAAADPRPGIDL